MFELEDEEEVDDEDEDHDVDDGDLVHEYVEHGGMEGHHGGLPVGLAEVHHPPAPHHPGHQVGGGEGGGERGGSTPPSGPSPPWTPGRIDSRQK